MEGTSTPRRSSRIVQKTLSIQPVRSFKRDYVWSWPNDKAGGRIDPDLVDFPTATTSNIKGKGKAPPVEERHYYYAVHRTMPSNVWSAKGKGRKKVPRDTFRLGDTVLVKRGFTYPSIGVIVALWETRRALPADEDESDNDEADENSSANQRRARLHWFQQPSELPQVRADREHAANEIYYTLSLTADVPVSDILAHCSVSSDPTAAAPTLDDADSYNYVCLYAIDPQKGIFYTFDWALHRARAMVSRPPSLDDEDTVADDNSISTLVSIRPHAWFVQPSEDAIDASPSKNFAASRKRKRPGDSDGESEDDISSGDEFEVEGGNLEGSASDSESDEEIDTIEERSESDEEGSIDVIGPHTPRKKRGTRRPNKRAKTTTSHLADRSNGVFRTPTKPRRDRDTIPSPTKPKTFSKVAPTPHSKAALRNRQKLSTRAQLAKNGETQRLAAPAFSFTDKALANLSKGKDAAHLRAMHVLHVGSRPGALPCRESEFDDILAKVLVLLEEGAGGCVYISGVPGTGKTATVHGVVRELHRMAKQSEINPFTYVEINGLKIPEASAAYGVLWESLSRHDVANEGHLRISSKEALKKLDRYFSSGSGSDPGNHACVVLMDELDQLVTAKQDVVYNFFNWPTLANSKLIVLAVANTMDLPERAMTGKVRSRLGMERVDFRPYSKEQLATIVQSRLNTALDGLDDAGPVMDVDAIRLACARVAGVSGDARRVLDVCRRAVELMHAKGNGGVVKAKDIAEVISEMQNSPTAAYIRDCTSFHERVMLAATWKCLKKTGLEVAKWDEVAYQHGNMVFALSPEADVHAHRRPTPSELTLVLDSLSASRALHVEDSRKGISDGERRVMLNLEENEVLRVLGDIGGPKWRSMLGT